MTGVAIEAASGNTGAVLVGGNDPAKVAAGNAHTLTAGQVLSLEADKNLEDSNFIMLDLSEMYWMAANAGDRLIVSYFGDANITN